MRRLRRRLNRRLMSRRTTTLRIHCWMTGMTSTTRTKHQMMSQLPPQTPLPRPATNGRVLLGVPQDLPQEAIRDNLAPLPKDDLAPLPKDDLALLPKDDLALLPKDDLAPLPRDDLALLPKDDLALLPRDDLALLPKDDLAPLVVVPGLDLGLGAPLPSSPVDFAPTTRRVQARQGTGRLGTS